MNKRHFLVIYTFSIGSLVGSSSTGVLTENGAYINNEKYQKDIKVHLSKERGVPVKDITILITNIIELSKNDIDDFFKTEEEYSSKDLSKFEDNTDYEVFEWLKE